MSVSFDELPSGPGKVTIVNPRTGKILFNDPNMANVGKGASINIPVADNVVIIIKRDIGRVFVLNENKLLNVYVDLYEFGKKDIYLWVEAQDTRYYLPVLTLSGATKQRVPVLRSFNNDYMYQNLSVMNIDLDALPNLMNIPTDSSSEDVQYTFGLDIGSYKSTFDFNL